MSYPKLANTEYTQTPTWGGNVLTLDIVQRIQYQCSRKMVWPCYWSTITILWDMSIHTGWSVTSLRGPGERNFNAVSHKPKLTGTDWIELNWCARSWLMGYGIKISIPRAPQDVTDHLVQERTIFANSPGIVWKKNRDKKNSYRLSHTVGQKYFYQSARKAVKV